MSEETEETKLLEHGDLDERSTLEKKQEFLDHLRTNCNVTKSATLTGIHRSVVYLWRKADDQFALDVEDAKEEAVECLEDEMHRRAFEGSLRVNKQGVYREYSDTLAIFLAKAHKPDRYNERIRNEITGPGGEPLILEDNRVAMKLNAILNVAMQRKDDAELTLQLEKDEDSFDDLC